MKEIWQDRIESLSEEEIFNYLTIDRGSYQKDAIEYAEKTLEKNKLNIIELQTKYNYNQESIVITKRINSEENIQKIEQNFIARGLEKYIHLIQEVSTSIKNRKKRKKKKSKIIFNAVLSLIYSLFFLSKNSGSTLNVYQFLIALMIPFFTPFVFGLIIELFKTKFSKEHKFEIFSDLFVKTWYYFIFVFHSNSFLNKLKLNEKLFIYISWNNYFDNHWKNS